VRVVPSDLPRANRREVTAGPTGAYSAGNPFTNQSDTSCAESPRTLDFTPGDSGRAYVRHADGNEVFAAYGRAMHVHQHENYAELYVYPTRDLDWDITPQRTVQVTLTPKQGPSTALAATPSPGRPGKTQVYLANAQGKVIIRGGDSLTATFDEGPNGVTRSTTIALEAMPLVTGSPDVETSTVGGIGPRAWGGRVTLNPQPVARPVPLAPRLYAAYGPVDFATASGSPIPLKEGYSGGVSFSDAAGHRVHTAWAATASPVKIAGYLAVGDTLVCGTAAPGTTVRIHDVTADGQDVVIGTGAADAQRRFCVTVPPLYRDQVIVAEAEGTYSQPAVIPVLPPPPTPVGTPAEPGQPPAHRLFIPAAPRNRGLS
jgi:hypothetical protein